MNISLKKSLYRRNLYWKEKLRLTEKRKKIWKRMTEKRKEIRRRMTEKKKGNIKKNDKKNIYYYYYY